MEYSPVWCYHNAGFDHVLGHGRVDSAIRHGQHPQCGLKHSLGHFPVPGMVQLSGNVVQHPEFISSDNTSSMFQYVGHQTATTTSRVMKKYQLTLNFFELLRKTKEYR